MAYKYNIAKMWNPANSSDLGRYFREEGTYGKLIDSEYHYNAFPVNFVNNEKEGSLFYFSLSAPPYGSLNKLYLKNFYSNYFKIIHISSSANLHPDARMCLYFNFTENNDLQILFKYSGIFTDGWNSYIGYKTTSETWNNVTQIKTTENSNERSSICIDYIAPYHYADVVGDIIVNMNMPYLPVFENESDATNYINDYTNEATYSKALNYYEYTSEQNYSDDSYNFKNIPSLINEYLKPDNINNSGDFIENILTPINDLLKIYQNNNFNFDEKIDNINEQIGEKTTEFAKYSGMDIIRRNLNNKVQYPFPTSAPFIPKREFSPFDSTDMSNISQFITNNITDPVSDNINYYAYILNTTLINNIECYNICVIKSKRILDEGTLDYPELFIQSKEDHDLYWEYDTSSSYVAKHNIEMVIWKDNHGGRFTANSFIYDPVNKQCYSWTIVEFNSPSIRHNEMITLGDMNLLVPFYCTGDIYISEVVNGENKEALWLKKDDSPLVYNQQQQNQSEINISGMVYIKPIVAIYNLYEQSFINGWDGNKLDMGDDFLIAPQIGAGLKDEDGLFTGLVMGVALQDVNKKQNQKIGLIGKYKGRQSLYLNAQDGSAIFGLSDKGQITIDPSTDKALIYSSSFYKNFKFDGKPTSYDTSNYAGAGMQIDFTTPEIRFGNGNFIVNSSGHITAAGGGHIAGWKISDTTIEGDVTVTNNKITLDSGARVTGTDAQGNKIYVYDGQPKICSGVHTTLNSTSPGFYLSNDGLSIGSGFKINTTGTFYIGYNASSFDCTNLNDPKNYTIGGTTESVYMGTEGIRLGKNFAIDHDGNIVTRHLVVSMKDGSTYDAIGCWIGNWQFSSNNNGSYISGVQQITDTSGTHWDRIWLSTEGIVKSERWTAEPPSGTSETMWEIRPDGSASFKNSVTISNLGGFNVGGNTGNYITNGNIKASTINVSTIEADTLKIKNGSNYTSASFGEFVITDVELVWTGGDITGVRLVRHGTRKYVTS